MKPQRRKNIVKLSRLEKKKVNKAPAPKPAEKRKAESWIEKESNWEDKLKKQEEFTLKELMRLHIRITEEKQKLESKIILTQALIEICLGELFLFFTWLFCGWLGIVSSALAGLFGGFAVADLLASWKMSRTKKEEEKEE